LVKMSISGTINFIQECCRLKPKSGVLEYSLLYSQIVDNT
jgi:hypothetical protein